MISCPNCQNDKLATINSRPNRIPDAVWRQRKCLKCKYVFETIERVYTDKPVKHTPKPPKPTQRPLNRQQKPKSKTNFAKIDLESLTDAQLEDLMFSNPEMFDEDEM